MNEPIEISIVIPVYESAETLPELVDRLVKTLNATSKIYKIILVDDGSNDHSWQVISNLVNSLPETIIGLQLMRNYGQHNALMCGFRQVRGSTVVTLDEDLQNPPEEIHHLLTALSDKMTDVVYGLPKLRQDRSWMKYTSLPIQFSFKNQLVCLAP